MSTVSEAELKQKISELAMFVREYAVNNKKRITIKDKRDKFVFSILDKDVTLEFTV